MLKAAIARPLHPGVRSAFTSYYLPLTMVAGTNQSAVGTNSIYYLPHYLGPATVDRISIRIAIGAAGGCRMGIYTNSGGMPDQLLVAAAPVDTSGTGVVEASFTAVTLPDDIVWACAVFDAAPTCRNGGSTVIGTHILGTSDDATGFRAINRAFTYGALPTTAPVPTGFSSVAPAVMLRKS
jgi:hypothetical protein